MNISALVLTLATLPGGSGADNAPTASARASIATQGDIWVGQRVTLVVELVTPGIFASAPDFDLPQVSGVVLMPPLGGPVLGSETVKEITYTTQRHELPVFAQRAGKIEIPAFVVRFDSSAGYGKPGIARSVITPPVSFTAKVPPGAEGLVTIITTHDLKAAQAWQPPPGKEPLKPGAAFTRTITVEARDVPAMVLPPLHFPPLDGIGAYPKRPLVEDHTDRGDLTGQRIDAIDYVCEKAGTYVFPAVILTWWDLSNKKLQRIELPGQTVEVSAPPLAVAATAAPVRPQRARTWVIATVTGLVAIAVAAWLLRARVAAWWKQRRLASAESEAAYFSAFERVCRSGDPHAAQRALYAWLDRFLVDVPAPSIAEFCRRAGDPALTAELAALTDALDGAAETTAANTFSAAKLAKQASTARSHLLRSSVTRPLRAPELPRLNPST